MRTLLIGASAVGLLVGLSSCEGPDDLPDNVAATANDVNDMNAMMADSDPFAETEMKMDQGISGAVGINAADSWVRKMIAHQKGAIAMSRVLLAANVTGPVADMAKQTIARKTAEMAALTKLVAAGDPDPASAALYRPAQVTMHDAMMAAQGSDRSDTWLRKMLEHHKGAVAMSEIALAHGATGAVKAQIEKTRADQQKEIEHIEAMLAGEQVGSGPTTTEPARAAARQKAPTAKPVPTKTAAKPAPAPAEPKSPEPDEPKAAEPACPPEHREAGHC